MAASSSPSKPGNPLAFLGLRPVGEEPESPPGPPPPGSPSKGGVELNRRGVPARKRKLNSLIYGTDDLVSIPVRSPRKKKKEVEAEAEEAGEEEAEGEESQDGEKRRRRAAAGRSPAKGSPRKTRSSAGTASTPATVSEGRKGSEMSSRQVWRKEKLLLS